MSDKEVRLINAKALMQRICGKECGQHFKSCDLEEDNSDTRCVFREYVQSEPAVEAQPVKHGRWILSDDKNWLTCSSCGADVDVSCGAPFFYVDNDEVSHINFCPNCGSKNRMDGDSE